MPTTQEKTQAVKAKIHELIPDIDKILTHQCVCGHSEFNHNWHLDHGSPTPIRDDCFHCVCKKFSETSVRPIMLADVLRAIDNMLVVVDAWGNFYVLEMKLNDKFPKFNKNNPTARYDLTKSYDEQSDEFKLFLHSLLCPGEGE